MAAIIVICAKKEILVRPLSYKMFNNGLISNIKVSIGAVITEDTLGMFKEFISSQTVRKNYYPPDNNIESD